MLFGQSLFQSVLERLNTEGELPEEPAEPLSHRVRGLNAGFAANVLDGVSVASQRPDQAYLDNIETAPPEVPPTEEQIVAEEPPEPPPMPEHLARVTPDEIAAELAISVADTMQSLGAKRRAFARANHPDGVALPYRHNATARMMIANRLIDEAIRRLTRKI